MMKYEDFKKKVLDEFKEYLPDSFSDYELYEKEVNKVNKVKEAFYLLPKDCKSTCGCPTMYVNDMYEAYICSNDFEYVMRHFANQHSNAMKHIPKVNVGNLLDSILDNVVFQVINPEHNEELLENCPHRYMLDLAVLYRVIIDVDKEGVSSFVVTNDMVHMADITEEELYNAAFKNTPNIFPKQIIPLSSYAKAKDEEITEDICFVLSDEYGFLGSNALMFNACFKEIGDKFSSDFYILPSSIRELIIIPTFLFDNSENLKEMVMSINHSCDMSVEDVLSDSIYKYCVKDDSISIVA